MADSASSQTEPVKFGGEVCQCLCKQYLPLGLVF